MISEDLFIAQPEVELGVARRACPHCSHPLIIRVPAAPVVEPLGSAALRLGLEVLAPQERVVFDAVYAYFPHAVTRATVCHAAGDVSDVGLRQIVMRIRSKLGKRGWLLLATGKSGTLRLVEPVPVVDLP